MSSILDDPDLEAIAEKLGMGKDDLKARFKAAAFDLHPDRNADNPGAATEFIALVRVREILEEITVEPPPKPLTFEEFIIGTRGKAAPSKPNDEDIDVRRFAMRYTDSGIQFSTTPTEK